MLSRTRLTSASGFSLIELLVVISIVAVLIAMLLPSLGAAREMGKTAKCLANQRQIFLGFMNYSENNRTYWTGSGYNHNIIWSRLVMAHLGLRYVGEQGMNIGAFSWNGNTLGNQGYGAPGYVYNLTTKSRNNLIMKCPSENFLNNWGGENATSYRYNSGYSYGYGMGLSDSYTVSTSASQRASLGRIKEHQVERPSNTFVIGDAIRANGDYEYTIRNLDTIAKASIYHNGGANFLFADGRAALVMHGNMTTDIFDRRK